MLSVLSSALVRLDAPGVTGGEHDRLLECLADVPDPRDRRGIRHELASVLAVAACAVLAGARSLVAIAEWAADASQQVLAALGSRQCVRTGARIAPGEATTRRVAQLADGDALDATLGRWLRRDDHVAACAGATGGWAALAADGKTVRGARQAGGKAPHLLAALTADGVVWAQRQVDVKSNEITALQPLLSDVDITTTDSIPSGCWQWHIEESPL